MDRKAEAFQFFETGFIQRTGNQQVPVYFSQHLADADQIVLDFIEQENFFVEMRALFKLLFLPVCLQLLFNPVQGGNDLRLLLGVIVDDRAVHRENGLLYLVIQPVDFGYVFAFFFQVGDVAYHVVDHQNADAANAHDGKNIGEKCSGDITAQFFCHICFPAAIPSGYDRMAA